MSSVIADSLDPACRFWFAVCIRGMLSLVIAYPLLTEILRVWVAIAKEKEIVSPQEAAAILQPLSKLLRYGLIKADYVIDLNLALENRQEARMDRLASTLEAKLQL